MPAVTISAAQRAKFVRYAGHDYASDATCEVAATLVSNRRVWDMVESMRGEGGKVDPELLRGVFASKVVAYGMRVDVSQIDWNEVAADFDPEPVREQIVARPQEHAVAGEAAPARPVADEEDDTDPFVAQAAKKARPIEAEALAVLRRCEATEVGVFLPQGQLERKLYTQINEVLEALGGKWNRSKKCHQFAQDPRSVLAVAQATGTYISPQDLGYFPTPKGLASQLLYAAELRPGMMVLEPSAGRGALADLAAEVVGVGNVHVVEMLPDNREALRGKGFDLIGEDFLAMDPAQSALYDRIIMNPPFENLADIAHVQHALKFLRPGGVLVSITSPSFQYRQAKKAAAFREIMEGAGEVVAQIESGAFRESGTDVATVMIRIEEDRLALRHGQAEQAEQNGSGSRSGQEAHETRETRETRERQRG